MTTGKELQELKDASIAAKAELNHHKEHRHMMGSGTAVSGVVALGLGINFLAISFTGNFPIFMISGIVGAVIGTALLVWAYASLLNPNKRSHELADQVTAASLAFVSPLHVEMREYGIDTESISAADSSPEDDSYEFTALRNGAVSEISVKTFDGLVVFLMNGQEMTKELASF
jgi:hypothetical protein